MLTFWIVTGLLALAVAVLLGLALLRRDDAAAPAEAFDMQVYRDQLAEVDRDIARGVVSAEDGARARAEVSRRLLAADAKLRAAQAATPQPRRLQIAVAAGIVLLVVAGAFGIYTRIGAPGYGDLGLASRIAAADEARANRPSQAEAEARVPAALPPEVEPAYAGLVERLRAAVADRPDDLQGLTLLARSEAALGNFGAAWKAQERIVTLKGDSATASDFADLADLMILAAGGYVSPEAERALQAALRLDPKNGTARYYAGLMMAQIGRPDAAFRAWEALLAEGPADAPWIAPIRAQIEDLAWRAGQLNFRLPPEPGLRGPSAGDIAAAQDMSDEDRQAMIAGMVAGLAERLASDGGSPEEWARLIGAYGVLGEQAKAVTAWNDAQKAYDGNAEALATIREGAKRAGLAIE